MKFDRAHSIAEIAEMVQCKYVINGTFHVTGINEIHNVVVGDICFVDHPKYYDKALMSAASVIIINQEVDCPEGKAIIISETPFLHFNLLSNYFSPFRAFPLVKNGGAIGENTQIMTGAIVHPDAVIGSDCTIFPGVVIYSGCELGNNVIIHANTVIGADAFYYNKKEGRYTRMHSCGKVFIGDNVEIGALCSIDKGVSSNTIIAQGSKLDNQIHIGHDTRLGENCLLAAATVIAGCVEIGNNVTIWGQVAIASNVKIGDNVEILAKSGVSKDLEAGKRYFGSPAEEARTKMKEMAKLKQLLESKA
ncbi:MAG: UDP-3-O-(3-hydroxymyristoyl)glucosamine N-acyltransferase [Pseudomonadota bacterium]